MIAKSFMAKLRKVWLAKRRSVLPVRCYGGNYTTPCFGFVFWFDDGEGRVFYQRFSRRSGDWLGEGDFPAEGETVKQLLGLIGCVVKGEHDRRRKA
jgi:hypothetical protein